MVVLDCTDVLRHYSASQLDLLADCAEEAKARAAPVFAKPAVASGLQVTPGDWDQLQLNC